MGRSVLMRREALSRRKFTLQLRPYWEQPTARGLEELWHLTKPPQKPASLDDINHVTGLREIQIADWQSDRTHRRLALRPLLASDERLYALEVIEGASHKTDVWLPGAEELATGTLDPKLVAAALEQFGDSLNYAEANNQQIDHAVAKLWRSLFLPPRPQVYDRLIARARNSAYGRALSYRDAMSGAYRGGGPGLGRRR